MKTKLSRQEAPPSDCDVWNVRALERPPLVSFDYAPDEYERRVGASSAFTLVFLAELDKLSSLLASSERALADEHSLLAKILYKNWNPLRKEPSLQAMKKLKRMLTSFVDLRIGELLKDVQQLSARRSHSHAAQPSQAINEALLAMLRRDASTRSLPSRETFEFLIVRLLGAHRLLQALRRLVATKLLTHLVRSIRHAIYLPNNVLFLSCVARIYVMCGKYGEHMTLVYNNLRSAIGALKATNIPWSERCFRLDELPARLATLSEVDTIGHDTKKLTDQLAQMAETTISRTSEDVVKCSEQDEEDIGERIERDGEEETAEENTNAFVAHKPLVKLLKSAARVLVICQRRRRSNDKDDRKGGSELKLFKKKVKRLLAKKDQSTCDLIREHLMQQRDAYTARIHAILKRQGIDTKKRRTKITQIFFDLLNKN